MKNISTKLVTIICLLTFIACDKPLEYFDLNDSDDELTGRVKYIITATPVGTQGVADYLLTADDLEGGSITTQGNGIEQDGTFRNYIVTKNRLFSLLYGQGTNGAVTTYRLNTDGELVKVSNFQSETVQVFAPIKDDILTIKVPRSGDGTAMMYRIDANKYQLVDEVPIDIVKLAGNGERAHFTGATQVDDKVYVPYLSIKGCCNDVFGTAYADSSWVAVLSYPELKVEKVIKDDRTGTIGAYYLNGLVQTEIGDVYGFSPSSGKNNSIHTSKKPSAIVKIDRSNQEFDKSYFFNIQELSGGYHIASWTYIGKNKFILAMYSQSGSVAGTERKFAIVDVTERSFRWIAGTPSDITRITTIYNYAPMDGIRGYIGITTASEGSYVYVFDANLASARKGIKVEGGTITAIQRLNY